MLLARTSLTAPPGPSRSALVAVGFGNGSRADLGRLLGQKAGEPKPKELPRRADVQVGEFALELRDRAANVTGNLGSFEPEGLDRVFELLDRLLGRVHRDDRGRRQAVGIVAVEVGIVPIGGAA